MKWFVARLISAPAFLMPYTVRIWYIQALSAVIHAPLRIFGTLAHFLLSQLSIEAEPAAYARHDTPPLNGQTSDTPVAVLFSGGTDSTCAAALAAQRHNCIHLLTFIEHATRNSPLPTHNAHLLQARFPEVQFLSRAISVDRLVRFFWYERYVRTVRQYGLLALATPGFSSLSWHVRTIAYCLEHGITKVADGLTRELMHFPGHMDASVDMFRFLYAAFGITYENPVRDWPTPPDRQFIEQVLVNRHEGEFLLGDASTEGRKTTGQYLFDAGVFSQPNIKGSRRDFSMQHDCYPFSLYNIIAFWGFLSVEPYAIFCLRIEKLMKDKADEALRLLRDYAKNPASSQLAELLQ